MTKIKRGHIARKQRRKIHLFTSLRGAHSILSRTTIQWKKRDFRALWISRINEVIGVNKKTYSSYHRLIYNMYKRQYLLN